MLAPDRPKNEKQRIQALQSYNILDTLPEEEYDDITRIAAQICGTPIALISLVDEDRQWFKSKQGLDPSETPREISFCGHAINSPGEFFEVPNSKKDPRFADNPLVVGDPNVVFYAGSPLVTPRGEAIGTLCVIDHEPREISQEKKETLQLLARQVITTLELRKQNKDFEVVNEQLVSEINTRKEREKELVQARDQALEAERIKDQFLSNMSHEIRTPMNGIIGITKLLLDEENLQQEHHKLLQHIDFSAKHLLRIINDILDLSKVRQNKLSFEQIDFDLTEFLDNMYQLLKRTAEEKGISLFLEKGAEIPARVNGDPNRLAQIILNIAGNAIKFTDEGQVTLKVAVVRETSSAVNLQFNITDTGIGIPTDKLAHIFDPFAQSDNSISRRFGGTGLGLSISNNLIEQFGGSITVESTEGVGSTFSFDIRLGFPTGKIQINEDKREEDILPSSPSLHILLVEDNRVNQVVANKHLNKMGFTVTTAESGEKALEALKKDTFDLILMDINMPGMNGLEATGVIRDSTESYSNIKIIALTASILGDDTQKYFEAGMDGFVSKPFNPDELYRKIMEMV